jgi:regulator of replication initiation timing
MKDVFCIPTTFLEEMNRHQKEQKLIAAEAKIAALAAENARLRVENDRLSALVERLANAVTTPRSA